MLCLLQVPNVWARCEDRLLDLIAKGCGCNLTPTRRTFAMSLADAEMVAEITCLRWTLVVTMSFNDST